MFTIFLHAFGINLEKPLYIRPTDAGKLPSLRPRVALRESETLYIRPTCTGKLPGQSLRVALTEMKNRLFTIASPGGI